MKRSPGDELSSCRAGPILHSRLIAETGGSKGIRDLNMILSALGRPRASCEQWDLYSDITSKDAVLMDPVIRNHLFIDGNERTGITAAAMFLQYLRIQVGGK